MDWRPAKSLLTLRDQVDAKWPDRDKSSDGILGDARHAATKSDHNPDAGGVVRAIDITDDPAHGLRSRKVAEDLLASRDSRIRYLISNAEIVFSPEAAEANGATAWVWKAYHGENPHTAHMHLSVSHDDALADDTRPWKLDGSVIAPPPSPATGTWQSGRGSWYSQFQEWVDEGDDPNSNALRVPDDYQGISFWDPLHHTLGKWFEVMAPNGITSIEQQSDVGPNPNTGRTIDISAVAAKTRFGYTQSNFPTDGIFKWRPAECPFGLKDLPPRDQAEQVYRIRSDPNVPLPRPVPVPPPPPPPPVDATALQAELDGILLRLDHIEANIEEWKNAMPPPPSDKIDWTPIIQQILAALYPLIKQLLPMLLAAAMPLLKDMLMQWITGKVTAVVRPAPATTPAPALGMPQGTVTGILGIIGAILSGIAPMVTQGVVTPEMSAAGALASLGVAGAGGIQATKNVIAKKE